MPKRARTSPNSPSFLAGLGLVFLGLYLFLSLASYSPKSVPSWAPIISTFSHYSSAPNNLVGPLGTQLACNSVFFLGASAYLLAMTSVGYGIAKWCVPGYRLRDKVGWGLLMVLIGACLIQIQPWFLGDWKTELRIEGPGGFLGLWIGQKAVSDDGQRVAISRIYVG
jgi:S-DNA-T family DNA segregation ATPase FtsK/SpoIIIE